MKKLIISITMAISVGLLMASAQTFSDTENHWAVNHIDTATEIGLFQGTGDEFEPELSITRGMFVTVIGRFAELQGVTIEETTDIAFGDVDKDAYYAKYTAWANENGIVNGYSADEFAPDDEITREQICAVFARFLSYMEFTGEYTVDAADFADQEKISAYATNGVDTLQQYGIINGVIKDDGTYFLPQDSATRAETAKMFVMLYDLFENSEETETPTKPSGGNNNSDSDDDDDDNNTTTPDDDTVIPDDIITEETVGTLGSLVEVFEETTFEEVLAEQDIVINSTKVATLADDIITVSNNALAFLDTLDSEEVATAGHVREEFAVEIADIKTNYLEIYENRVEETVDEEVVYTEEYLEAIIAFETIEGTLNEGDSIADILDLYGINTDILGDFIK
ncbi:MAG: S-layer homology domain-containing protein [Clostridia bacterium]